MIRAATVLACALTAAGCGPPRERPPARGSGGDGGHREERAQAPLAARDCGRARGDSARAVCTGLNEIERISGAQAELSAYQRRGDTTCVETLPAEIVATDGGGVVEIVRGRVASAFVVHSGGCRKF